MLDLGLGEWQRRSDIEQPRDDALDVAIDRRCFFAKRNRGDGSGSVRTNTRQRVECGFVRRKRAVVIANDRVGAFFQVPRARVVPKPRPHLQDRLFLCRGQVANRWPAGDEFFEIRNDGFDRRLLQHDFRQPDTIGIGFFARAIAPRQIAPFRVVPGQQRADRVRPCRTERQLLLCCGAHLPPINLQRGTSESLTHASPLA